VTNNVLRPFCGFQAAVVVAVPVTMVVVMVEAEEKGVCEH
jgi:hypothetical protein